MFLLLVFVLMCLLYLFFISVHFIGLLLYFILQYVFSHPSSHTPLLTPLLTPLFIPLFIPLFLHPSYPSSHTPHTPHTPLISFFGTPLHTKIINICLLQTFLGYSVVLRRSFDGCLLLGSFTALFCWVLLLVFLYSVCFDVFFYSFLLMCSFDVFFYSLLLQSSFIIFLFFFFYPSTSSTTVTVY